jgi:hypothetical protein
MAERNRAATAATFAELTLARAFYTDVVASLVTVPHTACVLGEGPEVLGYDSPPPAGGSAAIPREPDPVPIDQGPVGMADGGTRPSSAAGCMSVVVCGPCVTRR